MTPEQNEYYDKVFLYLKTSIRVGSRIKVSEIANDIEKFINAVKFLIDAHYIDDIEFSNDFIYIKRLSSI
jgi:hypothetical protein